MRKIQNGNGGVKDKAMKNRNEKIEIDNCVFASEAQVKFYVYLKRCREKGLLKKFIVHPKYLLQGCFSKHGERFSEVNYVADFEVMWNDGKRIAYDVKIKETSEDVLKRKLFIHHFNMPLRWIAVSEKYGNENGFIDWFQLKKIKKTGKGEKR